MKRAANGQRKWAVMRAVCILQFIHSTLLGPKLCLGLGRR
jgi:hypothetical protein